MKSGSLSGLEHSAALVRVKQRRETRFGRLGNSSCGQTRSSPQETHNVVNAERVNLSSLWQNNILFPTTTLGFEQSVGKPLVDRTKPKTSTSCLVFFSCLKSTFLPSCCFALYHCCGGVPNASWSRFRSSYKFRRKKPLFSQMSSHRYDVRYMHS